MHVAFGCDHTAIEMKRVLMAQAEAMGHTVTDCGIEAVGPDGSSDYPLYALRAAQKVASGACERGVVLCGTGIGISIAANKVPGIRCALLHDCYSAMMTRAHNDANMAAFGARVTGIEPAKMMLEIFLSTPFEGGRHQRRVDMIGRIEAGEALE